MEILSFTKDDDDIEGIVWALSLTSKPKSVSFHHTHVQITDSTEGSVIVSTNGAMLFKYETRDEINSGYYKVLKSTKTSADLHKEYDLDLDQHFPEWNEAFGQGPISWSGPVSSFDLIAVSKSFTDIVRNLPSDNSIIFEQFLVALSGPGIVLAEIYPVEVMSNLAVELSGGRCRAKVMTTFDESKKKGGEVKDF